MKAGDLVRFHMWKDLKDIDDWNTTPKERVGVLVHHDKLMGTVEILFEGKIVKERAQFVEKAGRKDIKPMWKEDDLPN